MSKSGTGLAAAPKKMGGGGGGGGAPPRLRPRRRARRAPGGPGAGLAPCIRPPAATPPATASGGAGASQRAAGRVGLPAGGQGPGSDPQLPAAGRRDHLAGQCGQTPARARRTCRGPRLRHRTPGMTLLSCLARWGGCAPGGDAGCGVRVLPRQRALPAHPRPEIIHRRWEACGPGNCACCWPGEKAGQADRSTKPGEGRRGTRRDGRQVRSQTCGSRFHRPRPQAAVGPGGWTASDPRRVTRAFTALTRVLV